MTILIGLTATSEAATAGPAFGGYGVRPPTYLVSQDYCRAIIAAGAIPVLLPHEPDLIDGMLGRLAGVLFTGGVDIHPQAYGESPHPLLGATDAARDAFELALFPRIWHETAMPVLGVCRGLQLLNVGLGGTLWQDLPSQRPGHVHHSQNDHRYKAVHPMRIASESQLGGLLGKVIAVNSLHHQGIKDLAPGLEAMAWSPDGLVEAVEAPGHPFRLAMQWHPENLATVYPEFHKVFARFVAAAYAYAEGAGIAGAGRSAG
jgi:putative glutamine amidotransferase